MSKKQERPQLFYVKYLKVQAFALHSNSLKDKKQMRFPGFSGSTCVHSVLVMNEFGAPELFDIFENNNDSDYVFVPAQSGIYAVVECHGHDELYVVGYISKDNIPVLEIGLMGGEYEVRLERSIIVGERPTKVCEKCRRIYTFDDPPFCVGCGSERVRYETIKWETDYKKYGVKHLGVVYGAEDFKRKK
ncbi:MAG: hypothetical protein FWD92_00050 [Methanomassiliicoccaceae archaeon]|nr:hypothetical protein [Methanomassiliicoccaceae archaeon]